MNFDEILSKYSSFYKMNSYIFRVGDNARNIYYIRSGKVILTKILGTIDRIIGILEPGEIFGEMALINSAERLSNAKAAEDSEILTLDEKVVVELMTVNTDFMLTVLKDMVKRIVKLSDMVSELSVDNIEIKVISTIIKYLNLKYKNSYIAIGLSELIRHVSIQLSIPTDEITAVFEKLYKKNLIIITGNNIAIRDISSLIRYKEELINSIS